MSTPTQVAGRIQHNGMQEVLTFTRDSQNRFTLLPKAIWRKLKIVPQRISERTGAAGIVRTVYYAECIVEIHDRRYRTVALLGDKADVARLGDITPIESESLAA